MRELTTLAAIRPVAAALPSRHPLGRLQRIQRCILMSVAMPQMPRRPLGKTGLEVSVLGFGASPLGGVFQASGSRLDHGSNRYACAGAAMV